MKFKVGKSGEGSEDSASFLRLKDKEKVKGIFQGEIYEFKTHWNGTFSEVCPQDSTCPHCVAGLKPKFRFRVNFVVKEKDVYVAKIFEQGWKVYNELNTLNSTYSLENYIFEISRSGAGLNDTKYTILPIPNGALNQVTKDLLSKVELIDLRHDKSAYDKPTSVSDANFKPVPVFNSDEEIPF